MSDQDSNDEGDQLSTVREENENAAQASHVADDEEEGDGQHEGEEGQSTEGKKVNPLESDPESEPEPELETKPEPVVNAPPPPRSKTQPRKKETISHWRTKHTEAFTDGTDLQKRRRIFRR